MCLRAYIRRSGAILPPEHAIEVGDVPEAGVQGDRADLLLLVAGCFLAV
jgi:hypothetical protein